jgi:hypothetical protein
MNSQFWKSPSEGLSLDNVEKLEIFRVRSQKIISEVEWPNSFWPSTTELILLDSLSAKKVISLFKAIQVGEPARCHMPPWGLAIYSSSGLIYTVTICFECTNCYVYSENGKELRAFEMSDLNSLELLKYFESLLPLN